MYLRFNPPVIALLILLASCQKIKYYPDKEFTDVTTRLLAHRGGGWGPFEENTLKEAISINPDFIQTDNIDYFQTEK